MSFEDKRQFHEQFARGFEAFAREGKAPTLALQSIFSRFGDWLKKIYASVKELNVSLNDDVRQIMGRMIATDRAIEETIAARNMGPLFSSAVDGESVGMTLEQYNAIQGLHQEAKDAEIAALQARSLKDMKWLSRAHDKALQERQREVDSLRKAMRLEVAKRS
ncbi:MAG: hypothetical protein IPO08_21885 [Xanthomonadales bacterium]|nr:hypothetical protein [Xanthomonadales bacterium]